jgi:hypothetical protein
VSYVNNPVKYFGNIVKEYKDWDKTMGGPSTAGKKQQAQEAGQFWGAVLQGRRYDKSGTQITPPTRNVGKIMPSRNMGKVAPVKRTPPKK